jgi:hypothetical protein
LYPRCSSAPADVKRRLRQEAFFGCCMCGNPLIDNAHIIEYHITKQFPVEDMLALCPNCHREADKGHMPKYVLRDVKQIPYNMNQRYVKKRFVVTGEKMVINIGSSRFINTERVFTVDDFDLVSINRIEGKYLSLNLNLFDRFNGFVALVYDNFWMVDRRYFWDIEYRPQHLIIRNAPRIISLEIRIQNEEVYLRGDLYYYGFLIPVSPQTINIGSVTIKGATVVNAGGGINVSTH